jgi:hypothetical protein
VSTERTESIERAEMVESTETHERAVYIESIENAEPFSASVPKLLSEPGVVRCTVMMERAVCSETYRDG